MSTTGRAQNTPWLAVFAGVLALITLCCSCGDKTDHTVQVGERVKYIRERTLPSDAIAANSSGPTLGAYSATANWEFGTNEERSVYLAWVRQGLEQDGFKLKSSDESSLVLIKNFRSEAESVKIQATPSSGKLQVQITYAADSD